MTARSLHAAGLQYDWPTHVYAACGSCGWVGPLRDVTAEAIEDARRHETEAEPE